MATDDAYLRACRAHHWRVAELRAHGVEPMQLTDEHPQYPPDGFVFGASEVYEVDAGENVDVWDVTLRFNGRVGGANQRIVVAVRAELPTDAVDYAMNRAVKAGGGSVFIRGYSVQARTDAQREASDGR